MSAQRTHAGGWGGLWGVGVGAARVEGADDRGAAAGLRARASAPSYSCHDTSSSSVSSPAASGGRAGSAAAAPPGAPARRRGSTHTRLSLATRQ